MADVVTLCAVLALSVAGMAAFAVITSRHWHDLIDRRRPPPRRLALAGRLIGTALLLAGQAVALAWDGPAFGLLQGVLLLTVAAIVVSTVMTALTRRRR